MAGFFGSSRRAKGAFRQLAGFCGSVRLQHMTKSWVGGSKALAVLGRGALVATLLLVACSQGQASPPTDNDNSGGFAGAGDSGGFEPVARAQPTESGAWVVDQGDPLTLYALGDRSMRSRDGGHTWAELAWPAGAQSLAIAQLPVPALYLRVSDPSGATSDRLLESVDAGDSWTDTKAALPSSDLVVVDRQDGPVLLASKDGHVLRSIDKGSTWVASVLPPAPGSELLPFEFGKIFVSKAANPVVYVAAASFASLLLVSTDAGATFVAKSLPSDISLTLSLDCRGRLYVMDGTQVYRSIDAGTSWQSLELGVDVYNFQVMQGGPAACGDSVYASGAVAGGGATLWQLQDGAVTHRALPDEGEFVDLGDDRLLVSTFGLRQRSDDGGRTWWTAGVNLGAGDLVVSPAGPGSLFVSTVGGVYRSADDGATWQGEPSPGSTPQDLYPDPHDVNVLYARNIYSDSSPWSFLSVDRGESFQDWPVPTSADPETPEAIVSTAPGVLTVVTRGGVYRTNDAGGHFAPLLTLPAPQQVMSGAIGSGDPPAIYAYVGGDDLAAHQILASLDGGATWASSDPGTYVTNLVVDPADPKVVFGLPGVSGDDGNVLRTLDGGLTWERIAVESEQYVSLHFDPRPPHALYMVGQRLYSSEDHGSTWHTVTELPTTLRDFALDPNAGRARYALGQRGLLYKMTE
jgi:photosystem II stability/assembly factor-like uncharacterized protein